MIFPPSAYTYVRPVDLLPMGDYASALDNERLKTLDGIFSVKLGESIKDVRKVSNNLNITAIQGASNKLHLSFNGIPTQEESTHRELNDILHKEFPEALLSYKAKTTIHKTPNNLNISADEILQDHQKYGSHTNFLMRRGFIYLRNPYHIIKNELINNWNPKWAHHLRGVLAGVRKPYILEGTQRDFLSGRNKKRYLQNITQEKLTELYNQLINGTSKDIAIPSNDNVIVGGNKLPISIYTLQKRQTQVSIGYDTLTIENLT